MFFLYTVLLLCLAAQDTWACSCMPTHLHNQVCRATAVFKGTVTSRVSSSTHMYYVHNVAIDEIFKDDGFLLEGLERVQVDTPIESSLCGLALNVGVTYFLQVSKTIHDRWMTGLCTSTQPWPLDAELSTRFTNTLRNMDCNCTVKECHTPFNNPDQVKECLSERLQYNECLYNPYVNTEGAPCGLQGRTCQMNAGFCDWTPSLPANCALPAPAPESPDVDAGVADDGSVTTDTDEDATLATGEGHVGLNGGENEVLVAGGEEGETVEEGEEP